MFHCKKNNSLSNENAQFWQLIYMPDQKIDPSQKASLT